MRIEATAAVFVRKLRGGKVILIAREKKKKASKTKPIVPILFVIFSTWFFVLSYDCVTLRSARGGEGKKKKKNERNKREKKKKERKKEKKKEKTKKKKDNGTTGLGHIK